MTRVLILGATGSIARVAIDLFINDTDASLTLFVRSERRLKMTESTCVRIVEGDVLDYDELKAAIVGHDVVYANLDGDLASMATNIVRAMNESGVRRLIFISAMGIYGEVPGEKYKSVLDPYRDAAQIIEGSSLDYTIIRPAWFTHVDEIDYETTQKGEPFRGRVVSRKSVAALIVKLAQSPHTEVRSSLGVAKPV